MSAPVPPEPFAVIAAQEPVHIELPVAVTIGPVQFITVTLLETNLLQVPSLTVCERLYVPVDKKV